MLEGRAELDDALVEVVKEGKPTGLELMPGSGTATRMAEMLSGEAMSELLDRLRERADIVVLDTPPSAVRVDAMMLIKQVDIIADVVMSDFARRRFIIKGIEEIVETGAPLTGCILNGGRTSSSKYGYYGHYGHYGRYGGKYGYYGYGSSGKKDKARSAE